MEDSEFSNYGVYAISDSLDLNLPNTEIKIKRVSKDVFSYMRKDSEDNLSERIIPVTSTDLTIEVAPIYPLNFPAHRTNYVYLEFETPIFLSQDSAAVIFARCPIEIGIFLVHQGHKDSLDCFTCDPQNARFGLYGTPESGTLCKYSKSEIVKSYDDSSPFINSVLKIHLQNALEGGHSVPKVVFPISDNSIYYKDKRAILDSIYAVLRKKITLEILEVSARPIQTDWTAAPIYDRTEKIKRLDIGAD